MKIVNLQWHLYRLPLRNSFTTAHGVLTAREGAVIEITTDEGISGIGEIAPLPEFGGSTLQSALASLATLATHLRGKRPTDALSLLHNSLEVGTIPASTACGLEIALLDLLGQAKACNLATLLTHPQTWQSYNDTPMYSSGDPRGRQVPSRLPSSSPSPHSHIQVNAVIGAPNAELAAIQARQAIQAGFSCVKLKMGNEIQTAIERAVAVREAIGPTIHLRLDANAGWNFEQACTILTNCEPLAIQYVEQPLKADDLAGAYKLRQEVSIPIAADEALNDLESARLILKEEAADIFIVKPQMAGGLLRGQQIIQEAAQHGTQSVITSTIEAGIGLVAALHLASALPEITLECGLATLHLLMDDLLVDDLPIHEGIMTVPTGPGLGVCLDREALERYNCLLRGSV